MYENQPLEKNERALKKNPKSAPLSDSPLLLQAKFPSDAALCSPSPLLSWHPAPESSTSKKRVHCGHTEQVSAHHCPSLTTQGWRNQFGSRPAPSPAHLNTQHMEPPLNPGWGHHTAQKPGWSTLLPRIQKRQALQMPGCLNIYL